MINKKQLSFLALLAGIFLSLGLITKIEYVTIACLYLGSALTVLVLLIVALNIFWWLGSK